MPTFTGNFTLEGDPTPLPTTLSIEGGTLRMNSRSHLIGEWPVSDIDLHETDGALIMLVEGEKVRLDLRDRSGFMSATGALRPPPESKATRRGRRSKKEAKTSVVTPPQTAPTPTRAAPADPGPSKALRKSMGEHVGSLFREIRPDLSEVTDRVRSLKTGPAIWIGLALFVAAVIFVPTAVIVTLTIIGTVATLIATFAYLDDSLRVRFPNRMPPIVLLSAGLAVLGLAVLVAVIR